jgi:hypothetical protein
MCRSDCSKNQEARPRNIGFDDCEIKPFYCRELLAFTFAAGFGGSSLKDY